MSYTVTLCDSSFGDVRTANIDLEARTSAGTALALKTNGAIAGGYGAVLTFTPQRRRFNIEIVTANTGFAPLVLEDLNGDRHPQTINVILLQLPARAAGTSPTNPAQVAQYIQQQSWSAEETEAVYTTIKTLSYGKRRLPGQRRTSFIQQNAEFILNALRIDPDLIVV